MPLIESCLSVLSIGSQVAGLHAWFSGLKTGRHMNRVLRELEEVKVEFERLSDSILYTPSFNQVIDIDRSRQQSAELRQVRQLAEPVQKALGQDILLSAVVKTPERLQHEFQQDPWRVLFDVRPASRATRPSNPDCVPILFSEHGIQYIGWQMRGALPSLLGCQYSDDLEPDASIVDSIIHLKPTPRTRASRKKSTEKSVPPSSDAKPKKLDPDRLKQILVKFTPHDELHVSPSIPERKLKNAILACQLPTHETPVGLVDLTVFGSSCNCVMFGTEGIYYHNAWVSHRSGPGALQYRAFPHRRFRAGGFLEVSLGKGEWIDTSGADRKLVLNILNRIKDTVGGT